MQLKNVGFIFLVTGFLVTSGITYAEDVESWIKDTAAAPKAEAVAKAKPAAEATTSVKPKSTIGGHTLEEIIYKISRAKVNLESYGSDLDGHGPKAIEHLNQALEELKQAQ